MHPVNALLRETKTIFNNASLDITMTFDKTNNY